MSTDFGPTSGWHQAINGTEGTHAIQQASLWFYIVSLKDDWIGCVPDENENTKYKK